MTPGPSPARAAYHEAGHVLLAHLLGGEVTLVTLESEEHEQEGHTEVRWRGLAERERQRRSALVALAGPVAEQIWRGEDLDDDSAAAFAADHAEIEAVLQGLAAPHERERTLRRWLQEVVAALRDPRTWEQLCRVADALEAHETLDADLLDELLEGPGG